MPSPFNVGDRVLGASQFQGNINNSRVYCGADDIRNHVPLKVLCPARRQSNITTYYRCPRLYLLRERLGLRRGGYKSAPYVGDIFHLGQHLRYAGHDAEAVEAQIDGDVAEKRVELYEWAEAADKLDLVDDMLLRMERDAALGKVMSQLHWETCPLDRTQYEVLNLEQEIGVTLRLKGVNHLVAGRLDGLLRHLQHPRGIVILDFKSSSEARMRSMMRSRGFHVQTLLYRVLASFLYPTEPIVGMIYAGIMRPNIRWKAEQVWDDYLLEVRGWYAGTKDQNPPFKQHKSPFKKNGQPRKNVDADGYILDPDTQRRAVYPRWDHSDKADAWLGNPPMRNFFVPFDGPVIHPELEHRLLVVGRASRALPLLSSYPCTGADTGLCEDYYGRSCPMLSICELQPDQYANEINMHYRVADADERRQDTEPNIDPAAEADPLPQQQDNRSCPTATAAATDPR